MRKAARMAAFELLRCLYFNKLGGINLCNEFSKGCGFGLLRLRSFARIQGLDRVLGRRGIGGFGQEGNLVVSSVGLHDGLRQNGRRCALTDKRPDAKAPGYSFVLSPGNYSLVSRMFSASLRARRPAVFIKTSRSESAARQMRISAMPSLLDIMQWNASDLP